MSDNVVNFPDMGVTPRPTLSENAFVNVQITHDCTVLHTNLSLKDAINYLADAFFETDQC